MLDPLVSLVSCGFLSVWLLFNQLAHWNQGLMEWFNFYFSITCHLWEDFICQKEGGGGECFTSLFVKNINYFQTCQIYQKVSLTRNKIKTTIQQLRKILAMCGFIFCMLLYNHMFVSLYIKTVCRNIDWGLFYASIDRENRWTIFPKKLLSKPRSCNWQTL